MHPILNIAIKAIRKGGNLLVQYYDARQKSHNNDRYRKILNKLFDYSEKEMKNIIYKFYPKHLIVSYRLFSKIPDKKNIYWIINIVDGITNYSKLFPHFCITISVYFKGKIIVSVIYDPLKNELFSSVKGQGAMLNGFRMRCSEFNDKNVDNTIINTNFFKIKNKINWKTCSYMLQKICLLNIGIRCTGSLSLDLAYVAVGRVSCFIGCIQKKLQFSVGELQIQESGGVIHNVSVNSENNTNCIITFIGPSKKINYLFEKLNIIQ